MSGSGLLTYGGADGLVRVTGPRWHDERLLDIAEAMNAVTGGFRPRLDCEGHDAT